MIEKVVDVNNLLFSYPAPRPRLVLDVPSFSLLAHEHTFLHGPSGSGKTTFLGILSGILQVKQGSVKIMGHDFSTMGGHERDLIRGAELGYIFQMFNLIPYLSVRENILLPLKLSKAKDSRMKVDPLSQVEELAAHLRIESLLDQPVTTLSVGQQQRVAAARALMGRPGLIIADEPTSSLDSEHRESFLRLLFEEAERAGSTVLFVSHDHSLKSLFKRVVSLADINRANAPDRDF